MAIKGVLKEELDNSIRMKEKYEEELSRLPVGSLIKKKIRGHVYYYVVLREEGKVKFNYKGKNVSEDLVNEYSKAKDLRNKYRHSISQLKKQIKFLKGALRGQESI
jgi:hypothetical protein